MFVYHNVILIQTQIPIYAKYFLCRKQRNMLVIQTKVFIFALAIREDIDASIKSVGCKYIKIVPNK
mgnify:CR=1 FL=1